MFKLIKNRLFVAVTLLVFTASLSTVMATENPGRGVQAKIPFTFTAADVQLPAGNYTIERTSNVTPTMVLHNEGNTVSVFLVVEDTSDNMQAEPSELVFHKIGGKDFLSEVRTDREVYQFEKSHQEKELLMDGSQFIAHTISSMAIGK